MKKITLLFFAFCCFTFTWQTSAQVLNENAGWPNAAWTITGTYNSTATAFEANPTTSQNFAFDDDDAGNGSNDNIAAESPVIDLTAAFTAGEVWLSVTSDYVYNWFNANEKLALQYYDFDSATWEDWYVFTQQDESPATIPTDNFCNGNTANFDSIILDISGFTATQLSNFRYRIYFNDNITGAAGWIYGFCFQSPTIISIEPPTDLLDYYNLQWPSAGTINAGEGYNVYAQAYEAGLTDVTSGQAPGIEAWIGYSTADTDPSGAGWTWHAATFNGEVGNNDEYMLNIGQQIMATGIYYYASRWRLNGGFYTYGGIQSDGSYGGVWGEDNNVSGVLTINGPANDECDNAVALTVNADYSCAVVTPGTTVGATASIQETTGLSGTVSNDVWFSFVATGNAHRISILDRVAVVGTSIDMGMGVYDGMDGCDALSFTATSDPETLNLTTLTAGRTYYVRVYGWSSSTPAHATFNICVGTPPAPPANDSCANAIDITATDVLCSSTVSGTTNSATSDNSCSTNYSNVWYTLTPSETGNYSFSRTGTGYISVWSGSCGTLTRLNTSCFSTSFQQVLDAGTTYYISVETSSGSQGDFELCVYRIVPPANDNIADAIPVDCGNTYAGSTATATSDNPITTATFGVGGTTNLISPNVWFKYTGTGTPEAVTVSLCNSAYDTAILVGTGTPGNITWVAGNDDSCGDNGQKSEAQFNSDGITTYYIMVRGYALGSTGIFELNVSCDAITPPPANDECAAAEALAFSVSASGTTAGATQNGDEAQPSCDSFGAISDVWYSVTLAAAGDLNIVTTLGTAVDANVAIYSACGGLQADQITCSDDNEGETVNATDLSAGTYYIRVWSNGSSETGTFDIVADFTLSNPELNNNNGFTYYPNPVKNTLQLNAQSNIQHVSIFNMLGQEVLRTVPNHVNSTVDMSTLQTGAYFVKVTINDRTETVRVIKQ